MGNNYYVMNSQPTPPPPPPPPPPRLITVINRKHLKIPLPSADYVVCELLLITRNLTLNGTCTKRSAQQIKLHKDKRAKNEMVITSYIIKLASTCR